MPPVGQRLHKRIDLDAAVQLGRAEEHAVVHPIAHVEAADDVAVEQRAVDLGDRLRRADDELVEERLVALDAVAGQRVDAIRGVVRLLVAQLRDTTQPAWPHGREIDRGRERDQLLARADVARRALAADVLLARLERQHVAGAALDVRGAADDAARHLADEFVAAREQPHVRATVTQRHPQRLPLRHDDIGAVHRGRPVQAEADRLGRHDEQRAGGMRCITPRRGIG